MQTSSNLIGSGLFYKKGSTFKSWKERDYQLHSNGQLSYFVPNTQEFKGVYDISSVEVALGSSDNVTHCGLPQSQAGYKVYVAL